MAECTVIKLRYSSVSCELACDEACVDYWTDGTPGAIVPGDRIYQDSECSICAVPGFYADRDCDESNQGCFTVAGPEDCMVDSITACEGGECTLISLSYSDVDCEEACVESCDPYYTDGVPGALVLGDRLFTDAECTLCALDGYYSDVPCPTEQNKCFTVVECEIVLIEDCPDPPCEEISLTYSDVDCADACDNACSTYYTDGTPGALIVGNKIYTDDECEVCAPDGYYSDVPCPTGQNKCFTVQGCEIVVIEDCPTCASINLSYSAISCEEACVGECIEYFTNGTPGALIVTDKLYLDAACISCAPDGYYADIPCGEYTQGCFTQLDCFITEITSCEAGEGCTPCDSIYSDEFNFVQTSTVPAINTWKTLWQATPRINPDTGNVLHIDRHYLKQIYIQNCCEDEDWDTSFCVRFYNESGQTEALLLNGYKLESCERFTVLTYESPLYLSWTTRIDIAASRLSGWSISAIIEADNTYTGRKSTISTLNT